MARRRTTPKPDQAMNEVAPDMMIDDSTAQHPVKVIAAIDTPAVDTALVDAQVDGIEVKWYEPEQIGLNPENARKKFNKMPELLAQIVAERKIQQVCWIIPSEAPDRYTVVEGNQRTMALKLIKDRATMTPEQLKNSVDQVEIEAGYGYDALDFDYKAVRMQIPAAIAPEDQRTKPALLRLQYFAGTGQTNLSLSEQAPAILSLIKELGSATAAAKFLGCPQKRQTFSKMGVVFVSKRNEDVVKAVEGGLMDVGTASELLGAVTQSTVSDHLEALFRLMSARGRVSISRGLLGEYLALINNPPKAPEEKKVKNVLSRNDSLSVLRDCIGVLTGIHDSESDDFSDEDLSAIADKATATINLYVKRAKGVDPESLPSHEPESESESESESMPESVPDLGLMPM